MNLWHDVDPGDENGINVIIEIPKWSKNKYEIDKESGLISLDRAMHTAQDYPMDYGFVPRTLWDDNDALDVVVLTTYSLHPGILVNVKPVGILKVNDSGESDDKILALPKSDPRYDNMDDIKDINPHTIREIIHFFETYKNLSEKTVKVEEVGDANMARKAFLRGREMYDGKFSK